MTSLSLRAHFEPRSESRPDIVERDSFYEANRAMIAREKQIVRRYAIIGIAIFSIVFVGALLATWHEQSSMTQRQQTTIEHIVN